MAPPPAAKREMEASTTVADKSPSGGFLFVQYPSDARLGRKHLQSKSMKEHLSRRRRIQKIHKFRNVNVPVATSANAETELQIPPEINYHTGLPTPKSLPSAGLPSAGLEQATNEQEVRLEDIEEVGQDLWDVLDWEPFQAARQREQAEQAARGRSSEGSQSLSPTSQKSVSSYDAPMILRGKPSSTTSDPSSGGQPEINIMDPWNTGWTMFAAVGAKVPVKMDSDAYLILQHRMLRAFPTQKQH